MNSRRDFFKKSGLMAVGMVIGHSSKVLASSGSFPEGIIYTKENPGRWAKKVAIHVPDVNVEGKHVTITTKHPMSEQHYIVRHTLVSADGKVLGDKTFYPSDKVAVSTFELPMNHGSKLYATSFCNLHDFWLTEFTV
jgi:superoxide reductase